MAARLGRCLVFAPLLVVAGCGEPDAIRIHDEAVPVRTPASIPAKDKVYRTLAAMVPADLTESELKQTGPAWFFFKTSGPYATVEKYEKDFNTIVESIITSADEKDPVKFTTPAGWTLEKADKSKSEFIISIATLKAPGGELELTVTRAGGPVLSNVQRWWGQLWGEDKKLEFTGPMLPDYMRERNIHGRLILTVDLAGPNDPKLGPKMKGPHGGM